MALIHETLYRTKKYFPGRYDVYLSTLAGQVVSSYEFSKVHTDCLWMPMVLPSIFSRATPCGLIINELLTNSLK